MDIAPEEMEVVNGAQAEEKASAVTFSPPSPLPHCLSLSPSASLLSLTASLLSLTESLLAEEEKAPFAAEKEAFGCFGTGQRSN